MFIYGGHIFSRDSVLFKAKPLGDREGSWVYGYYVRGVLHENGEERVIHTIYSKDIESIDESGNPVYREAVQVDEFTVRVCTGIIVDTVHPLWEGDYVLYHGILYLVRYSSSGGFYLYNPVFPDLADKYYIYLSSLSYKSCFNLKYVGNDVDNSIEDIRIRYREIPVEDSKENGYYIEIDAEHGGKIFTLYDLEDREVGRYLIGDHQIVGYELCLGDMGYVQYDEFLRRKMESEGQV